MIQLLKTLPKDIGVAVSGGVDSIAVCDFLSRSKNVTVIHFNHKILGSEEEASFVADFCTRNKLPMIYGSASVSNKPKNESKEEFWRNQRYSFMKDIDMPIVLGHTLDDAVETYLFSSFHGEGHIIPYQHANMIRPFLSTKKEEMIKWCESHDISWLEDKTNSNPAFASRNRIRLNILPEVLKINPGIYKVIGKKIEQRYKEK